MPLETPTPIELLAYTSIGMGVVTLVLLTVHLAMKRIWTSE